MLNLRLLIKSGKVKGALHPPSAFNTPNRINADFQVFTGRLRRLPSTASRSGGGSGCDWHSPLTAFETLSGVGFRRILNTQMPARIGPVKDFGVMLKGNPSCW